MSLHTSRWLAWLAVLLVACGAVALQPAYVSDAAAYQVQPLVTTVLRYNSSDAGEVALVWGVNGWNTLPEEQRPAGTTIVKSVSEAMQTPMHSSNGSFEVTLQVPTGATIDYIFHITRARSGVKAEAWDENRLPERSFHTIIRANGVTDVTPTISLGHELLSSGADVSLQWVAALIILGMTLLFGFVAVRFHSRNPYLDY